MDEPNIHYTVLARRFRPQSFADVVGQEHVAQGLCNAIQKSKVAHAYLFAGARGVGKTSMARILAKSLNCLNAQDTQSCNTCEICLGISGGNDVDVLEIDGASNRGIDDIRLLRANVNVKSMRTRYKVYIIDEVHMLTKEAFNALLKTLEEPPRNVKFIFCTTEPSKIPDTILSRCQRFDFSAIATSSITQRLEQIAVAEGNQVDDDALDMVARRAAGSMRDSQSLFDQLLAFGDDHITRSDVHRLFGTASDERLAQIVGALIDRRRDTSLEFLETALNEGVQLSELTDQLIHYLRDLMVIAARADGVTLLSVSKTNRVQLTQQAQNWGLQTIVAAMQILAETKAQMQRVSFGRPLIELALIRISLLDNLEDLEGLISELKNLSRDTQANPAAVQHLKPGLEKKNESEDQADEETIADPEVSNESGEIWAGTDQELWTQILSRINDMLRNHAQRVSTAAKSGPNRLDLTFPQRYHFHKQYCERAEVIARLEGIAQEITGEPIRISVFLAKDSGQPPGNPTAAVSAETAEPSSRKADEFVQKAISIFDATVEKVIPLSKSSVRKD